MGNGIAGARKTAESQHLVDIRYMHKHGMLTPGCTGSWKWTTGGAESIGFTLLEGRLLLSYGYRKHGGEWQEVTEAVQLAYTSCTSAGGVPGSFPVS